MAIEYLEDAARQGHTLAAVELAYLYQLEGPWKDYAKAYEKARFAAEHGAASAWFVLGTLLFLGRGCQPDALQAEKYFEQAAKKGIYAAEVMLEKVRRTGRGAAGTEE